jgi:hypothetical protein
MLCKEASHFMSLQGSEEKRRRYREGVSVTQQMHKLSKKNKNLDDSTTHRQQKITFISIYNLSKQFFLINIQQVRMIFVCRNSLW